MDTIDKDNTLCCAECGNIHVQMKAWVDINTREFCTDADNEAPEDYWCDECCDLVDICTVAEFEEKQQQKKQ